MKAQQFSRGKLARLAGVNFETVRYYEGAGLMPEPQRSEGGHRIYDKSHTKRLSFIRRCRELGFNLNEIRGLLSLVDGDDYTCAEVLNRTNAHIEDIKAKIRDLRKMERILKGMASRCDGGMVPECPIVDTLFSDSGF